MNPHSKHATSLASAARSLASHARLLRDLTWREISGRYRGSVLGITWSVLTPLMMLAVYTFVFSVIFKARWSGLEAGRGGRAMASTLLGKCLWVSFSTDTAGQASPA